MPDDTRTDQSRRMYAASRARVIRSRMSARCASVAVSSRRCEARSTAASRVRSSARASDWIVPAAEERRIAAEALGLLSAD